MARISLKQIDASLITTTTSNNFNMVANFSLSEIKTNAAWLDGKPIYRKTVSIGALPNNNVKTTAHHINDIDFIIDFNNICRSGDEFIKLNFSPAIVYSGITGAISLKIDKTNIYISTDMDYSSIVNCYVTIYYTKLQDNSSALTLF